MTEDKLNILLLGSGGRECALAWKLAQSPELDQLFIAPGNAGTAQYGTNVALNPMDFEQVADFCKNNSIDMLIVGSEDPLVAGITDSMQKALPHMLVIGPTKAGAQLEGSKDFAKQFMQKYGIPTAAHLSVTAQNLDEGLRFLEQQQAPYVLKADGLAAGKGVLIINDLDEAKAELRAMLEGKFGNTSATVVMEQFLKSPERDQIQVLFAHNDDMALGAIQAIEEAGKKPGKDIIIVSCDGVKEMFKQILAGKANCTVECNPMIGGQLYDVVEGYMRGEPIPPRVESQEGVFDAKNITQEVIDQRGY